MQIERRAAPREKASLYVNEFIDGVPCLCEVVEMSTTGLLLRRILGPSTERATYALEMAKELWLCATPVWRDDDLEALSFVASSPADQLKLSALIGDLAAC